MCILGMCVFLYIYKDVHAALFETAKNKGRLTVYRFKNGQIMSHISIKDKAALSVIKGKCSQYIEKRKILQNSVYTIR